jgi:ferredoxin
MKVWIDQDLCTGDGLCEEICPTMFNLVGGIAYVRDANGEPMLLGGTSEISDAQMDAVLDAAEECPGECIFIDA